LLRCGNDGRFIVQERQAPIGSYEEKQCSRQNQRGSSSRLHKGHGKKDYLMLGEHDIGVSLKAE
jgi:hypothetical protein